MISFKNYYKQRIKTGLAVNITGMVLTVMLLSVGSVAICYSVLYERAMLTLGYQGERMKTSI
jgi:hypothetical protein